VLCFGVLWAVYGTGPWVLADVVGGDLWNRLFWINVVLVIFNMIPAYPMDGGRVLRALLALTMDHSKATRIATGIGQAMALVIGVLGFLVLNNPILILIALFVWMGAAQEGAVARARSGLAGATVRRAMVTRFDALAPADSLGWALQQSLHSGQKDFPVLEEGRLVGMLTRMDLREGIDREGFEAPVHVAMRSVPTPLSPADGLETAMERMEENRMPALPVTHEDHLLGLVTVENIQEFLAIRHMLRERPQAGAGWYARRRDESAWTR
jgi:CBS domain-containing protein